MDIREIEKQIQDYARREAEALKDADKLEQKCNDLKKDLEKQKVRVAEMEREFKKAEEELREMEKELTAEVDKQTKYLNIVLLNRKVQGELTQKKVRLQQEEARRAK